MALGVVEASIYNAIAILKKERNYADDL